MRTAQERGGKAKASSLSFLLRLTQIDRASPLGATERRRLAWGEAVSLCPMNRQQDLIAPLRERIQHSGIQEPLGQYG